MRLQACEKTARAMTTSDISPAEEIISFINRDHIVSVEIRHHRITIFTTDGRSINIPAIEDTTLTKFADDLANSVQSNFVSITYRDRSDRFVDEGLDFITIAQQESG